MGLYPQNGDSFVTIYSLTSLHPTGSLHQGEVTSENIWLQNYHHFVGINPWQCVELMGEDLLHYSNKTESSGLRQCPYDD